MNTRLVLLILLTCISIFGACHSDQDDPTPLSSSFKNDGPVDIEVFIGGFSEDQLDCVYKSIEPERLPLVVLAFVNVMDRGARAETVDEQASAAFYECTPDEFATLRIVSRARLAALSMTGAPYKLGQANFPSTEESFEKVYDRMPDRIGDLLKTSDRPMSIVYTSDPLDLRSGISLQIWSDFEADPDFNGWNAVDRILGQVTLYSRYAQRMEPGTNGDLVWVSMVLDVEETLHRFIWAETEGDVWYLVEGPDESLFEQAIRAFVDASR